MKAKSIGGKMNSKTKFTPIIGAEIHVELKTKSKMFCGCKNDPFGAKKPNIYTCPVCLGLPGAIPVPNKKAIDWTIALGLALNCQIEKESKFDRKHYFYPDLAKGYQISQYDQPFCTNGFVETSFGKVGITRVHLEEDTAKLQHAKVNGKNVSLIDFNRSGVPLVEIVTKPDIHSSKQAKEFLTIVRNIVRSIDISDANMEKGSMRLEANISLSKDGSLPDYKVEVKNINSFKFFGLSVETEIIRQTKILESGKVPKQETRGWREDKKTTVSQRSKEVAADYRYFPEPDIPPIVTSQSHIESIKSNLKELPQDKKQRWIKEYALRVDYASILSSKKDSIEFIDETLILIKENNLDSNQVIGQIINKKIDIKNLSPKDFVTKFLNQANDKINQESELKNWIDQAIKELPQVANDYQEGKDAAIGSLIGKVMGISHGKADGNAVKDLIQKKLRN
jgi:aspartyl-tRNA(Asn)/glutamyl-tRNA(Gln) amidotransferase subunit B